MGEAQAAAWFLQLGFHPAGWKRRGKQVLVGLPDSKQGRLFAHGVCSTGILPWKVLLFPFQCRDSIQSIAYEIFSSRVQFSS